MTTPEQLQTEIDQLAHDMVRLEQWAHEAWLRGNYTRVGELYTQREDVQAERSALIRGLWHLRTNQRAARAELI